MSLVNTWVKVATSAGRSKTQALARMNAALGTRTSISRLREWERGARDVPASARRYMLRTVLPSVLGESAGRSALRRAFDALS